MTVIGAGLAGCEATFQLAQRGFDVTLVEQKPKARTPAQTTDAFCELVCSNSLRGAALVNAVGLLKEELRRAGSLILRSADEAAVPAGGALAVDRERFSERVTRALEQHPRVTIVHDVVESIPNADHPVILATGPLTGDALAKDIARTIGSEHRAYYDAIAPIVATESIDMTKAYKKSRYDKGGDDAYVNCPMDEAQYRAFVAALLAAQKVEPRAFEHFEAPPRGAPRRTPCTAVRPSGSSRTRHRRLCRSATSCTPSPCRSSRPRRSARWRRSTRGARGRARPRCPSRARRP